MDHGHMDHGGHGGMDHGDMDMGSCSMNVRFLPGYIVSKVHDIDAHLQPDGLPLVNQEPLHRLRKLAHHQHSIPGLLPACYRRPDRRLRACP